MKAKSETARPAGRPPVLDEAKKREIIAILTVGCSRAAAAEYVGCHVATIRNTADRDEEFGLRLTQAELSHEIVHLKHINSAAKDARYWRASAWALERSNPQRYGQRKPHTLTPEQVSQVLSHFAAVITEEVPDEAMCQRLIRRLNELTAGWKPPTEESDSDEA